MSHTDPSNNNPAHIDTAHTDTAQTDEQERLLPGQNEVKMRLYGQGLGDCFLLAFPRDGEPENPCYILIDCGVGMNTPDEKFRMQEIVRNICLAVGGKPATECEPARKGKLDVVVVTHEHYDHVIGFLHAQEQWQNLEVDAVWVAWTEDPEDPDTRTLSVTKKAFTSAVVNTLERSLALGADKETVQALAVEASFLGIDSEAPADKSKIGRAMTAAKSLCPKDRLTFCHPGDIRDLPGTDVLAFVLGPPHFAKDGKPIAKKNTPLIKLLVDEEEMYHYSDFDLSTGITASGNKKNPTSAPSHQFALDADHSMNALLQGMIGTADALSPDAFNRYCPFDAAFRMDWDEALVQPFFWEHYTSQQPWRRVDSDWLGNAADLALRAGDIINNLSLVLAFELPRTKRVLLFVGDAQVGNWLSWHQIDSWIKWTGSQKETYPKKVDMRNLLNRVTFYKVGHHGSHNATIKEKGLELMGKGEEGIDTELTAFIPVSVPVAHDILGYCPMPFYPILRALQAKTCGRVFLSNGELLRPLPPEVNENESQLWENVRRSTKRLPAKVVTKTGDEIEKEVPLYLDFTVKDS